MKQEQEGIMLSTLGSAMSIGYICNKMLLSFLNVEMSIFIWFLFGSLFNLAYLLLSKRIDEIKMIIKSWRKILMVGFFTNLGAILWFYGTLMEDPTNVAFIFQFSRIFIALIGIFIFGERLKTSEYFGVILAFIGGLILTYTGEEAKVLNSLILFTSAFSYAMTHILAKVYVKDISPPSLAAGRSMIVAGAMLAYALIFGKFKTNIPLEALGWASLGALTAPFLSVTLYYEAYKRIEISKAAAILSAQPFFTALYMAILFSYLPTLKQLISGSIITLGILMLTTRKE